MLYWLTVYFLLLNWHLFCSMRLKGQMLYVPDTDLMLFLCSPSVLNMDDLHRRGLYLSDIPLHDATRDLVLLSEQFEAEYKLTRNLEILTDKLQLTYRELEDEKKKTDKYDIIKFSLHSLSVVPFTNIMPNIVICPVLQYDIVEL